MVILTLTYFNDATAEYLFVEGKNTYSKNWMEYSSELNLNLRNLFQKLSKSTTGKSLILKANQKAKGYGKTIYDIIEAGRGSITDTTLIRRFSPDDPQQVSYETRSKVVINKSLNMYDAVLDLAHELTHFVYRQEFNPYRRNFSLDDFIKSTVEGVGGEVQAFMMECKILYELFPKRITSRYNCKKIINPNTGEISRELAIKRFYSIGPYYANFKNKLDSHGLSKSFPDLTNEGVSFVSSAYGMPYPVAAYHEYMTVLTKVCENDKKRIAFMGKSSAPSRSVASSIVTQARQEYLDRCSIVSDLSNISEN